MRVLITAIAGPHQGQVFSFTGHDTFLVGRSKRAHFRLQEKDEYFSRIHFLVEVNPPHCRLVDMKSTNGTYVNGLKVLVADLTDGDLIQGGHTVLRISLESADCEGGAWRVPADFIPAMPSTTGPTPRLPGQWPTAPALSKQPELTGPVSASCRVCDALVGNAQPASDRATLDNLHLCAGCRGRMGGQPQPIPGYQLVQELGKGGMGVVYLALHLADGAVVALKTIKPEVNASEATVERFLREASILRELDHPGIVAFRDQGEAGGLLFFAMDFVPGADAAHLLEQEGPWSIPRAVRLICQLLEALDYAHGLRFVHRDIKPANLLVTKVQEREEVKLLDFGLARVYQASKLSGLTLAGQVGGTAPFMAPEQILSFRECRPPVDQYAAGATLYNLLTGKYIHDFPRSFQERMLMILHDRAVPIRSRRPDIPEELANIIHRSLAKESAERFADVREMRQALLGLVEGAGSPSE